MDAQFPAAGNSYLVDFTAFRVVLNFHSESSLTYTVLNPDGSAGQIESVAIHVRPVTDQIFLVTWQEADKTVVVHVEDFQARTIITNITNPDLSFEQFAGHFQPVDPSAALAAAPAALSYAKDIRPLFRDVPDLACMKPRGYLLDDPAWMCDPTNAQDVYDAVSTQRMPKDGPWPPARIALFKQWMDQGYKP